VEDSRSTEPGASNAEAVWKDVLAVLIKSGVDEQLLQAAAADGPDALAGLVARYLTFPGERRYTPPEVMERSGVDEETARSLWRAMGFAEAPDEERAFTDADVEALRVATQLFDRTGMEWPVALQQARVMSQAVARVATSQQDVIGAIVAGPDPIRAALDTVTLADEALPALDHLLLYMYRRHLAAAAEQFLHVASDERGTTELSVGFADLTGFTALSQQLGVRDLASLIERFNGITADAIAVNGGRIIKTIGDEVMFSANDPAAAASIALAQVGAVSPDAGFPPLRVGVATGAVIAREGDLFGPTVNLASRLVVVANPDSVLVDPATHDALAGDDRFDLKPIAARHLKGFGRVRPYRLRRAAEG